MKLFAYLFTIFFCVLTFGQQNGWQNLPGYGAVSWKSSVINFAALPANGNTAGDARAIQSTGQVYVWNGSAWIPAGGGVTNVTASAPLQSSGGSTPNISFIPQTANSVAYWNGSGVPAADASASYQVGYTPAAIGIPVNGPFARPGIDGYVFGSLDTSTDVATTNIGFLSGSNTTSGAAQTTGGMIAGTGGVSSATSTASSGNITFRSGPVSGSGSTGQLAFQSGSQNGTGSSGAIQFQTGSAAGNSGDISFVIGSSGATKGLLQFQDGTQGTSGSFWVSADTSGSGHWAQNLNYNGSQLVTDLVDSWGGLHVEGRSGGEASISLHPDTVSNGSAGQWVLATNGSSMSNTNDFAIYNAPNATQPFYISQSTNYVGIQQNNPQEALHVSGGNLRIGDPSNDHSLIFGGTNSSILWSTSGTAIAYNVGNLDLKAPSTDSIEFLPNGASSPTAAFSGAGLNLNGSTSGEFTQSAAATTTSYSIAWPTAQGAANTQIQNDGSGNLSWANTIAVNRRYVDFLNGNDSTGNGTSASPWKTLQKAYNSISPSINEPYTIYLSGGNNDTDTAITAKPNVSLVADYQIQISPSFTISGGSTNDNASFTNIIFVGAFNWVRNDATEIGVAFNNTQFFSGPTVQQQGSGVLAVTAINSVFANASFQIPNGGFGLFNDCSFFGTTTFGDPGSAGTSYLEFIGGYSSGAMTINGFYNPVYFTGFVHDVVFGASLAFTNSGSGYAAVEADSNGLPPTYTGSPTITYLSQFKYLNGNTAITTLTGDVTATGPGAAAATLATVNADVGSWTLSNITVNAKGLITAASSTATGNLTDAGTDGITITGGIGAVIGSGTSIAQHVADTTHNGYLSSTDWNTFNSKQAAGNYITALTGDATASGPGSTALTLATVNGSPGTFAIATVNVNGKGLVTSASAASTTGSGSVVLATAPTMTNPVVGTQSQGDSSTKAASTAYVDVAVANAVSGINPAVAVQAATTSAGNTSGYTYNNGVGGIGATLTANASNTPLVVDGYTFTAIGQRLLVKNDTQSPSGAYNGVYYVTQLQAALLPVILTRALDYDQPSDINNTGSIPVINGIVNGTTSWVLASQITTVGTDPLTFTEFTRSPADYLLKANNLSDVASPSTAFNNISPMTTGGDIIYGGSSGAGTRLPNGSAGQVLTSNGGTSAPSWQTPGGGGGSNVLCDLNVGSGQTYTTISSAVTAATAGQSICIKTGVYSESVSVAKQLNIMGSGRGVEITGSLTIASGGDYSIVEKVKVDSGITVNSGVLDVQLISFWNASGQTITDNGTGSFIQGMQE